MLLQARISFIGVVIDSHTFVCVLTRSDMFVHCLTGSCNTPTQIVIGRIVLGGFSEVLEVCLGRFVGALGGMFCRLLDGF